MPQQRWYYPDDIASDLQGVNLPPEMKAEIFACAWEYTRCVIPQYTNWKRYVAFMRILVMGIIAEFRGSLVDISAGDNILGYSLDGTLAELFEGTSGHADMAREYKTFLLFTSDKTSERRNGQLFHRYVNALASSPQQWFRMRDCDALVRFTIAAALACNDLDHVLHTAEQLRILTEIGVTLYDAVAFFKHRAEGETNNTFAYVPEDSRVEAFRVAREVLWALDVASAKSPEHFIAINFVRFFGGPIHMMMRRYRFVEEDLSIGKPENQDVIQGARGNFKLWNRVAADESFTATYDDRYHAMLARQSELMFHGLADFLEDGNGSNCQHCHNRATSGARSSLQFGGVELCSVCREQWRVFVKTLPERTKNAFPSVNIN